MGNHSLFESLFGASRSYCLNSIAKPPAGYFSLRGQRKVTKRKATLLLGFAAQNFPPSGTISGVVAKGHPWPSTPQLGIPPN